MSNRGNGRGRIGGDIAAVPFSSSRGRAMSRPAPVLNNSGIVTGIDAATQYTNRGIDENANVDAGISIHEQVVQSSMISYLSQGSTTEKKKRGKTRGLDLAKHRIQGEKIKLGWSSKIGRPISKSRKRLNWFTTEVGIAVRNDARMDVKSWTHVPDDNKTKLIKRIRSKFDLPTDGSVNIGILKIMGERFTDYRSRLKSNFLSHDSIEKAIADKPEKFNQKYWDFLCELWQNDKYLEKCKKYKANKSKQTHKHCAGSSAFYKAGIPNIEEQQERIDEAEDEDELEEKDELEVNNEMGTDLVETWRVTHYSMKKKAWVDEESKIIYEKLKAATEKAIADGKPLTAEELSVLVLGYKSGYIRGLGRGPKPTASSSRLPSRAQLIIDLEERQRATLEAQERCELAKSDALEARKQAEEVHGKVKQLEESNAASMASMQLQIATLQQQFASRLPSV